MRYGEFWIFASLGIFLFATGTSLNAKDVAGYVETAIVYPQGLSVQTKLDTGADNSSISTQNPEFFMRDGVKWVRFQVTNQEKETATFEQAVTRTATIKRHNDKTQERPVVRMGICVGEVYREVEVNLVDRSGFNYPVLIGRNFLEDNFLIDPSQQFLLKPACGLEN